ncbi:hypothetical protein pCM2_0069 (plasmid) [Clavibacter michiganensis subsp. michiganensis NCPPB 382]|uniref:Uncharacterized protein n=1 Tax=Clavibacter michiganensis subsp. michiganensis (strain NCPPB 382) TaxID=443906 RepID=A5CLT2_CLAM3|nr:hypothetical protein pCM2_0069 [Clavibacter michiganensis subsp. michiganensis NCPPB 382]
MGERISGRNKGACDRVPKISEEPAAQPLALRPQVATRERSDRAAEGFTAKNGPAGPREGCRAAAQIRQAAPRSGTDQANSAASRLRSSITYACWTRSTRWRASPM